MQNIQKTGQQPTGEDTHSLAALLAAAETAIEPPAEAAPFLTVVYLGKEQSLTREEAITLAQKGLNYDRIAAELAALRANLAELADGSELLSILGGYAAAVGENPVSLVAEMQRICREAGLSQSDWGETRRVQEWEAFSHRFPEMPDPRKLPDTVWEEIGNGLSPSEAYLLCRVKELTEALAATEKTTAAQLRQQTHRQKAVGSLRSMGSPAGQDAFLAGLLGL